MYNPGTKLNDGYKSIKLMLDDTLSALVPVRARRSFMVSIQSSGIVHTSIADMCIAAGIAGAAIGIVDPIKAYRLLSWQEGASWLLRRV